MKRFAVLMAAAAMVCAAGQAQAQINELPGRTPQPQQPQQPQQSGQVIQGITGAQLQGLAQQLFGQVQAGQDNNGNPQLTVQSSNANFFVSGVGCEQGRCLYIHLFAGFRGGSMDAQTLAQFNAFHSEKLFGRAFTNGEIVFFDWGTFVTGVTPQYVAGIMRSWNEIVLPAFIQSMSSGGGNGGVSLDASADGEAEAKFVSLSHEELATHMDKMAGPDMSGIKAALKQSAAQQ